MAPIKRSGKKSKSSFEEERLPISSKNERPRVVVIRRKWIFLLAVIAVFGWRLRNKEEPQTKGMELPVVSKRKTIYPATIRHHTKKIQIENYRKGNGLMLNIHATHHGGTSFCDILGRSGGPTSKEEIAPSFACWFDKESAVPREEQTKYSLLTKSNFLATTPWSYNETGLFVKALRPYYHMTSWEYNGVDTMGKNLSETNWNHPQLLSVVVTRHPISRLLAGSRNLLLNYPGYNTGTLSHEGWWDLAKNPARKVTDNFFFRILEGSLPGVPLNHDHYQKAVSVLEGFTIVLDIECLSDGMKALAKLVGLNMETIEKQIAKMEAQRKTRKKHAHSQLSLQERIGYEDVYEYLVEKNYWDIRLYEHSKTLSLVRCDQ